MNRSNWQQVPVLECGQPLERAEGPRLFVSSQYHALGYACALDAVWLRRDVVRRLREAAQLLPPDLGLLLWDGWRPLQLQTELYQQYRSRIAAETGLEGEALEQETQRFVKLPSSNPQAPSPHLTGGAVDLTLCDLEGQPLDMGGEFDELSDRSRTDFYESAEGTEPRNRRRLLCAVMAHVGFVNYAEEWFHFSCGDQMAGSAVGCPARYGPVLKHPNQPGWSTQVRVDELVNALTFGMGLDEYLGTLSAQRMPHESVLERLKAEALDAFELEAHRDR